MVEIIVDSGFTSEISAVEALNAYLITEEPWISMFAKVEPYTTVNGRQRWKILGYRSTMADALEQVRNNSLTKANR